MRIYNTHNRRMRQLYRYIILWAVMADLLLSALIVKDAIAAPVVFLEIPAKHQEIKPISVAIDYTKIPKGKVLDVIAQCESSNDYGAQVAGSSAFGRYQITKATFADANKALGGKLSILNPRDQDLAATWLLDTRGMKPWNASKSCWSKIIGKNPNF